ncbi:MAG: HTTM domain-containing protein [Gemmataceae bacterium]|nr:HTTM domain-containing protein [Gemmataceae bacterium]MDW8266474.1 HTTM domain-containing protein [Gemmataceae bacterium]
MTHDPTERPVNPEKEAVAGGEGGDTAANGRGFRQRLREVVQAWNRFWFTPADPTPLGLIRICTGLLVLYIHWAYGTDLYELMGPEAWLDLPTMNLFRTEFPYMKQPSSWEEEPLPEPTDPAERKELEEFRARWNRDKRQAIALGQTAWSIWFHVTDPGWMLAVHRAFLGIMVLYTLGVATRITSVLTWLAALSYINRGQTSLFGVDTMMNIALIYTMIGPSGAALSVDRLIGRWWQTYRALRRHEPPPVLRPQPLVSANFAIRLMQVHFCIIYFAAGISKLLGNSWWTGTALWWTLANYEFAPLRYPFYEEALRWLCRHRWLWEITMTGGVLYTLVLEIGFPFLVWTRLRGLMVAAAVLFHTGIAVLMGLKMFGIAMLVLLMSFASPQTVRQFVRTLGRAVPVREWEYSATDRRQLLLASLVHACDVSERIRLRERSARP